MPDICIHQVSDMSSMDSQYAGVTVIRLLDLKRSQPDVFARLVRLEDHNERRREEEEELWSYHHQHVTSFLKKVTCWCWESVNTFIPGLPCGPHRGRNIRCDRENVYKLWRPRAAP